MYDCVCEFMCVLYVYICVYKCVCVREREYVCVCVHTEHKKVVVLTKCC